MSSLFKKIKERRQQFCWTQMSSVYQNKDLGFWFLCNELTTMQIKSCFQDTFANHCCRHLSVFGSLQTPGQNSHVTSCQTNRLHSQTAMITNTHCTAHHVPPVPRFSGVFTSFHSYRESTSSLCLQQPLLRRMKAWPLTG